MEKREVIKVYIIVFTAILAIILGFKLVRLLKNKRNADSLESIDEDLVIMLNEGDYNG